MLLASITNSQKQIHPICILPEFRVTLETILTREVLSNTYLSS